MFVWSCHVRRSGVSVTTFVDDRTFWTTVPQADGPLRAAKQASNEFDEAFGFACRPPKCAVAAPHSRAHEGRRLADLLGYELLEQLKVVGVAHDLNCIGSRALLKLDLAVVQIVAESIQALPISYHRRRNLLRQFLLPRVLWAPGVVAANPTLLKEVQGKVLQAFNGRGLCDTPLCVLQAVLGYDCDPRTLACFHTLKLGIAFHTSPPAWKDRCDGSFAALPWSDAVVGVPQVLDQLQWWVSGDFHHIHRRDTFGTVRTFLLGFDPPSILMDWITDHFRRLDLHRCKRVRLSLHRAEDVYTELARGLDLPGISPHQLCFFQGHVELFKHATERHQRQTALATGATCWHHFHQVPDLYESPLAVCMCGLFVPSRPHLAWVVTQPATFGVMSLCPPIAQRKGCLQLRPMSVPLLSRGTCLHMSSRVQPPAAEGSCNSNATLLSPQMVHTNSARPLLPCICRKLTSVVSSK